MRSCARTLLVVSMSCVPLQAFGWGQTGHRVVGEIAARHVSPWTARQVAVLLDGESLAEASNWPDEIKSDPSWERAYTWHFISIDDGETIETTARDSRGDVLEALHRLESVMRSSTATRQERAEALKFFVHFTGDVHQPLHVGRRADRGGNDIRLTWMGQSRNLHSVWDDALLESLDLSFTELADFIDDPTPAQVSTWQAASYEDWVRESFALRTAVYDIGDGKLSWGYRYKALPIVERRLLEGGVRLAGRLDAIFAPPVPPLASLPAASPQPAAAPASAALAPAPGGDVREELLAADRAFYAATRDRGLEGWLEVLSDDAVRMPQVGAAAVRGRGAIRALDVALFVDPAVELRWDPTDAGAFSGDDHGFTTGRFEVVRIAAEGETTVGTGSYVTWWRRAPDGSWQVILDTGTSDPPAAAGGD